MAAQARELRVVKGHGASSLHDGMKSGCILNEVYSAYILITCSIIFKIIICPPAMLGFRFFWPLFPWESQCTNSAAGA